MSIAGYEYRIDGGSWVDIGLPVDPLTTTVGGLAPLTAYAFEMRWYDELGVRHEISNEADATTLGLPAMIQWLRPEAYPALNDGDPIRLWPDSSTYGHNATQPTGSPPIIRKAQLAGFPIARFDGNGSQIQLLTTPNWTAAEIVIVIKLAFDPPHSISGPYAPGGLWCFSTSSSPNFYPSADGDIYENFASLVRQDTGNPAASLATWRIYSVYSAANDFATYFEGTQFFHTASNTVGYQQTRAVLGPSWATFPVLATPFLAGDVAELILWDKKLTTGERNTVVSYLQTKYGL